MFDKLETVENRFVSIEESLAQPGLDGREMIRLTKERAEVLELVELYRKYKALKADEIIAREMLSSSDADAKAMGQEELSIILSEIEKLEQELIFLLLPKDPNDSKNVILEVRAGTGGDEAAIFAGDLFRMYSRYADRRGWKIELISSTSSERGGFREVIASIEGNKVFSRLKFERGVHRVQRVPDTEAQGRIHTSACTVAVLPEAEDVEVHINPADLEITACRASGAGGQHINKTDSAIRIVHKPSGLVVECQEERSQLKNKERALKVLKSRLFAKLQSEQDAEISAERKSQVGSGDRSERIRTYNFPQGRLTDHRINLTLYSLSEIMEGGLDGLFDSLGVAHTAELLKEQSSRS
jgi:peptide chain release factor 1